MATGYGVCEASWRVAVWSAAVYSTQLVGAATEKLRGGKQPREMLLMYWALNKESSTWTQRDIQTEWPLQHCRIALAYYPLYMLQRGVFCHRAAVELSTWDLDWGQIEVTKISTSDFILWGLDLTSAKPFKFLVLQK